MLTGSRCPEGSPRPLHITSVLFSDTRLGRAIRRASVALAFCAVGGDVSVARAEPQAGSIRELKQLSMEELMSLQVTSVSGSPEVLGGVAAAVTVVTNEDIRRSGARTVPEALRLVPGIHVARQTSSTWAIASRGFSSLNSEKLLVLADTRSIYTPLFSGVFWDAQHVLLQDVDRMEVIRGPGATLWGANAVNGVINITTKSARDTQGLYAETGGGATESGFVAARYGGRMAEGAHYRIFGQFFDRDATFNPGATSQDDWRAGHGGFRVDWDVAGRDTLTVQGDFYRGFVGQVEPAVSVIDREGPTGRLRVSLGGGNVLARWRRTLSAASDLQLRVYYDRTHRNDPSFLDDLHTVDFDFQHRVSPARRHELTWGSSYRLMDNRNEGRGIFNVVPPSSRDHLVSGFIQDQVQILDALRVTVGTKLEHNDFSGTEIQPGARAAWDVSADHLVWGAISRAVRVPTRLERDVAIDASNPAMDPVLRLQGNPEFGAERLVAYEAGYRWQPLARVSADVAAFHNRYDGLASVEVGTPYLDPSSGRTIVPLQSENLTTGHASGVEALVTYTPLRTARLSASYAHVNTSLEPGGADLNRGALAEDATPRHQVGIRSSADLPGRFQVDALFRRVSQIRRLPLSLTGGGVPGYSELDIRLAWLGWRSAELSLVARDLLHAHHQEFGFREIRSEVERGIYGKISWGF